MYFVVNVRQINKKVANFAEVFVKHYLDYNYVLFVGNLSLLEISGRVSN